jgi:hypothetical protein
VVECDGLSCSRPGFTLLGRRPDYDAVVNVVVEDLRHAANGMASFLFWDAGKQQLY